MLVLYGKLKKFASKAFSVDELLTMADSEILTRLEDSDYGDMTTLALLGTEYAAVGSQSARLRKVLEMVSIPVVLIAETEALLENKRPVNPYVNIAIEKSKKADSLRSQIDKYVKWSLDFQDIGEMRSKTPLLEENKVISPMSNLPGLDGENLMAPLHVAKSTVAVTHVIDAAAPVVQPTTPNIENADIDAKSDEVPPQMIVREIVKEVPVEVHLPLFNYPIQRIPRYSPLKFEKLDDILDHLKSKWRIDARL